MQCVFEAGAKVAIVTYEQKLVFVFEERLAVSCSEFKLVSGPNARRARKSVEIASALPALRYFEIGKGLGLGNENNIDVTKVSVEIGFAFDGAVFNAVFEHAKNAAKLGREDALHYEAVIPEVFC